MKLAQHRLSRRLKFRGLDVSIETDEGELRHWTDASTGEAGKTKMSVPYGYIRRTEGVDGDHVDVFVGPHEDAENVYVIHQRKAPDFKSFDEDKCMLGFHTADEAKTAYKNHYNDDRFFGSMSVLPFEKFKTKALSTFESPRKIAMSLYEFPHSVGCSRALTDLGLAKTSMARPKTLSESMHEADTISRQLRSFARRTPDMLGTESSHNLASKTLDDLPTKAAHAAIYERRCKRAAEKLGWPWSKPALGTLGPQAQASQRGAVVAAGYSVPVDKNQEMRWPQQPVNVTKPQAPPAPAPAAMAQNQKLTASRAAFTNWDQAGR